MSRWAWFRRKSTGDTGRGQGSPRLCVVDELGQLCFPFAVGPTREGTRHIQSAEVEAVYLCHQ